MASLSGARRETKKVKFLKALAERGTFSQAAAATRISRDAIHDWMRRDPAFSSAAYAAKTHFENKPADELRKTFEYFSVVVKQLVPSTWWPWLERELQNALRSKVSAEPPTAGPSRPAHAPMPHEPHVVEASTPGGFGALRHPFSELNVH